MVHETSCLSVIVSYAVSPTDNKERKHKKNASMLPRGTITITMPGWSNSNSNSNTATATTTVTMVVTATATATQQQQQQEQQGLEQQQQRWQQRRQWQQQWQQWWQQQQLQDQQWQQSSNSKQEQSDWQSVVKVVVMVTSTTDQWRPQQWPPNGSSNPTEAGGKYYQDDAVARSFTCQVVLATDVTVLQAATARCVHCQSVWQSSAASSSHKRRQGSS